MRSFLLALFCLLSPAAALRAPARAPGALSLASAPPAAVRATASPSMALPSFADAKGLTEEELLQEISNAKKARSPACAPGIAPRVPLLALGRDGGRPLVPSQRTRPSDVAPTRAVRSSS